MSWLKSLLRRLGLGQKEPTLVKDPVEAGLSQSFLTKKLSRDHEKSARDVLLVEEEAKISQARSTMSGQALTNAVQDIASVWWFNNSHRFD